MHTCTPERDYATPALPRRNQPIAQPRHTLLFGTSPAMKELRALIACVRDTDVPVLIQGESGTGKELIARALGSRRHGQAAFVKVNCAALPTELFESELFGYEQGSFTGADHAKPGKFEMADGGSIFLDEIGEIPLALQAKLLHVLQGGYYSRIGAHQASHSTARIIAATNRDLDHEVHRGGFRADLLFRLNVIPVRVPPLRERRADIPQLITFFADRWAAQHDRPRMVFSSAFVGQCLRHHWPGNIRELENVVQRAILLGSEEPLQQALDGPRLVVSVNRPTTPPAAARPVPEQAPPALSRSLKDVARDAARAAEGACIARMLGVTQGNRPQAARNLDVCYKSFLKKARQHGL